MPAVSVDQSHNLDLNLGGPFSQSVGNLNRIVGFQKETAAFWKILVRRQFMSRSYDYVDRRPSMADGVGEFETVHRARHLNIGEHHLDISTTLQYPHRLVRILGFYDLEAEI
jgi:hypothetical protein